MDNVMSTTSGSKNVLASDVEIKGNLKFVGELTFDGKLEGEINTEGLLNLGESAVVTEVQHQALPQHAVQPPFGGARIVAMYRLAVHIEHDQVDVVAIAFPVVEQLERAAAAQNKTLRQPLIRRDGVEDAKVDETSPRSLDGRFIRRRPPFHVCQALRTVNRHDLLLAVRARSL